MNKREKWTKKEDEKLKLILSKSTAKLDWDKISEEMQNSNIKKTSKQCRERWFHQLDPDLKKGKWSNEENKKLFELHKKIGSKWKEIAEFFKGRTDNCIKNQFFSLIRKSLRNARKILGKVSNTISVNKIRPKVLSDFMRKKINVVFPTNLKRKKFPKEKIVFMNDFVVRFVFNNLHQLLTKLDDRDVYVIEKSLEFLRDLNKNYLKKKNKIKKNKKKIPDIINSNTKEKNIGFNKLNHNKNDKNLFEKRKGLQKLDIEYKNDDTPLINSLFAFEKKKKEFEKLNNEYFLNPDRALNEKRNFAENLKKIGEISYLMYDAINKSSSKDFEETFSSQSKKNRFTFLSNSNVLQKSDTLDDNEYKNQHEKNEFSLSNLYSNIKNQSTDLLQSFINTNVNSNTNINVKETNFSPSHFAFSNSNIKEKEKDKNYDISRFNNFYNQKFDQSVSKMTIQYNQNHSNNNSLNLFESQTSNFSNK